MSSTYSRLGTSIGRPSKNDLVFRQISGNGAITTSDATDSQQKRPPRAPNFVAETTASSSPKFGRPGGRFAYSAWHGSTTDR